MIFFLFLSNITTRYPGQSSINLENCILFRIQSSSYGGAIYQSGGSLKTIRCLFYECVSSSYAGGIYCSSTNSIIKESCFFMDRAPHASSFMLEDSTNSVNLSTTVIIDPESYWLSSYRRSSSVTSNCNVSHSVNYAAGCFDYANDPKIHILFSFYYNVTTSFIALDYANSGCNNCVNRNCNFIRLTTSGSFIYPGHPISFINCDFIDNKYGYLFHSAGSGVRFTECVITFPLTDITSGGGTHTNCTQFSQVHSAPYVSKCVHLFSEQFTGEKAAVISALVYLFVLLL